MAEPARKTSAAHPVEERIAALDWAAARTSLSERGYALTAPILAPEECASLAAMYAEATRFRSQIVMERYRFGVGDYKYFGDPLPEIVSSLRTSAYPHLKAFLKICHKAGQIKPTPLLLHYEAGGYNCLHQDIYGEVAFPLQMVFLLGQPGRDWEGGEFLLVEQQPRAQSKAEVVHADQGQAIVFTTRYRPVRGARGYYRVSMKHGVSRVHRGTRYTLGIIFHDAK